jgi:hypothetical protein
LSQRGAVMRSPEFVIYGSAVDAQDGICMKTITIRQPWAWLIVTGKKGIENRSWRTHYRGKLLIHAAARFDDCSLEEVETKYRVKLPPRDEMRLGGVVGICELVDCVTEHHSKWFIGPFGFVLKNARERPFKKINGALGLWNYP